MRIQTLKNECAFCGYWLGWKLLSLLPYRLAYRIMMLFADVYTRNGKQPEQLRKNLSRVVGPENVTRSLVKNSMRSYMRYWLEVFCLQSVISDENFYESYTVSIQGIEHLDAAIERGEGVILALPHSGNWDLAGAWFAHRYGRFSTVAERLKPEKLYEAFVDFRRSLGIDVIPLKGASKPPLKLLEDVLDMGGVVCLLADRDLGGHGVPVDFFGEQTTMPAGAAVLAERTGATLLGVHSAYEAFGDTSSWVTRVSAPIVEDSVEDRVEQLAVWFEQCVAEYPEDWHVLQPFWIADRKRR
ncbi:phosphatidylinositol mannoside acyltransferase [Corynebacterium sp. NML130628]|uniref:phosphatidylinositol mannoside acyltransferase n=1 Tax=Corynebacterium sp. NML130628 TaxID=1906333 RepID=UPI0008FBB6B0|nr:phosphatidylinositol mannoside acyltransferase [Corynebacterium sp. NML130628]OIR45541.1 phosphatidylinositol mannoside acyltransferase [Corynebacterium sp. NML130628]